MGLNVLQRTSRALGQEDPGPVGTGERGPARSRIALLALLVVDGAVFAVEVAGDGHGIPVPVLAFAPLVASLLLPARLTGLVAAWSVLLAAALVALHDIPDRRALATVGVVLLLAAFAVVNCVVRWRERHHLQVVSDIARVAESALLREVPERSATARFATRYQSAAESARIGGDLLEVVPDPDGSDVALVIGDVRGKGLPAVHHAMTALGSFRAAVSVRGMPLLDVARMVDEAVSREVGDEDFVTALFGRLGSSGFLEVVNCGHPPPLRLTRDGQLQALSPRVAAPPLGLSPRPGLDCYHLGTGDRLVFCTDGLLEARNRTGQFFRFEDHLDALAVPSLDAAAEQVMGRLRRHVGGRLTDDVALLLVEVSDADLSPAPVGGGPDGHCYREGPTPVHPRRSRP